MKNILITGGLGFVGMPLANKLSKKFNITIIDTRKIKIKNKNIKVYNYDFASNKSIKIISSLNIDTVLHLAAFTNVLESEKKKKKYKINNYYKSKIFFKKLKKIDTIKTFLFASSAAVYGDNKNKVKETSACEPTNYYGKTKLFYENFLLNQKTNIKIIITRFFNIVSEYNQDKNTKSFFNNLANSIKKRKMFYIYGNKFNTPDGYCYRDFIEIKILIKFVEKLLKLNNKKIIVNIGTGTPTSIGEIVFLIKKKYKNKFGYKILESNPSEIVYSCANMKKLKNLLKIKKIPTVNFVKSIDRRLKN
jgi:UDP-glucose 4-epimerase